MAYKQYPKPLSEKTLQKKYAELGLSDEKLSFLKQFILACTNLYGRITIGDIWEVYKKLGGMTAVPQIKRVDILRISDVLRRDELPYLVFEIDEIYTEEPRKELSREFVSKYLVGQGPGKFATYYYVAEAQSYHEYYVPQNLLSFVNMPVPKQEKDLLNFVGKLKVTADKYEDRYGHVVECSGRKGRTLDSFSFMNQMEVFEYQYAKGEINGKEKPKEAQRLLAESNSMTEAEKIVDRIKWYINIGHVSSTKMVQYTLDEIGEAGVQLTKKQVEKLIQGIMDMNNYSHLMCTGGWRPVDLAKNSPMPSTITFGPGVRQAIAEGKLDEKELVKAINAMGMDVEMGH